MKNKKKIIIIGGIVLIVAVAVYLILGQANSGMEVTVIDVEESSIVKTVDMSGSVFANDSQDIEIPAGVEVREVYFEENDFVNKGDVLALLDSVDLNLQLEKAKVSLAQINADINNPGSKIPGTDDKVLTNNIEKANEAYKKAESDLVLAKEELEKTKLLYQVGGISESDFKNQETLVENLESGLEIASLNLKDAELRYSDYFSQTGDIKKDLERQRQIALLDIQDIEDKIKDSIEDSEIKAEISGVITKFDLKKDRKTNNNEIIKIQDPDSFKFIAMVPQEDAILIEKDQDAYITIVGVAGTYDGSVSSKSKTAIVDQASGSSTPKFEITIEILNEDDSFVSGFDADASVETGVVENTLTLKNEAIKTDEDGNDFVYLVDNDNKARKTIVETGLSDGFKTQIISGLEAVDRVVSNPPMELSDGSDLKIE